MLVKSTLDQAKNSIINIASFYPVLKYAMTATKLHAKIDNFKNQTEINTSDYDSDYKDVTKYLVYDINAVEYDDMYEYYVSRREFWEDYYDLYK